MAENIDPTLVSEHSRYIGSSWPRTETVTPSMGFPSADVTDPLILPCAFCEKALGATTRVASTGANRDTAPNRILKFSHLSSLVSSWNQISVFKYEIISSISFGVRPYLKAGIKVGPPFIMKLSGPLLDLASRPY